MLDGKRFFILSPDFVAIDFETAGPLRSSACAVAAVTVKDLEITDEWKTLIRPPRGTRFTLTRIHGIRWRDVMHSPQWPTIWPELHERLKSAPVTVAHNASFERTVIERACARYHIPHPTLTYHDTMMIARHWVGLAPASLPALCRAAGVRLSNHHDALADARAAAQCYIETVKAIRKLAAERSRKAGRGG